MAKFPDWIYRQSAVLPYRWRSKELEVLLITSRSGRRWVLPKGIVEPGMTAPASAAKEAREEAGIEGLVSQKNAGKYRQNKWGGTCQIEVFPMRVTFELETWPEAAIRRREWLLLKAAVKRVESKKLIKILQGLPQWLGEHPEDDSVAARVETPRLIYLLRHGKASRNQSAQADFKRRLTARGHAACESMSEYIRLADVEPGLVLCSSAVRARETLAKIRPALGEEAKVRFGKQIYEGDALTLRECLRAVPDAVTKVLLVGHNPDIHALALQLIGRGTPEDRARLAKKFTAGALATLVFGPKSWQDLGSGTCELHSLVTPHQLTRKDERQRA